MMNALELFPSPLEVIRFISIANAYLEVALESRFPSPLEVIRFISYNGDAQNRLVNKVSVPSRGN